MSDNDIRRLLNYIVAHPMAEIEAQAEQLTATAREPDEQVAANIAHDVQTEREAAERMLPEFAGALRAASAQRATNSPVVLDDSDPQQDAMASALVRFLVKPNLAAVETTEVDEGHYSYSVSVDWAALERYGQLAGVDLATALA